MLTLEAYKGPAVPKTEDTEGEHGFPWPLPVLPTVRPTLLRHRSPTDRAE